MLVILIIFINVRLFVLILCQLPVSIIRYKWNNIWAYTYHAQFKLSVKYTTKWYVNFSQTIGPGPIFNLPVDPLWISLRHPLRATYSASKDREGTYEVEEPTGNVFAAL